MEQTFQNALASCATGRWATSKDGPRSIQRAKDMIRCLFLGDANYMGHKISEVSYQSVKQTVDCMKIDGATSSTINRRLSALSAVLDEANKLWGIPKIPLPFGPESQGRKETLTKREVHQLAEALRARDFKFGSLTAFLVESGMRLGEALAIRNEDLIEDPAGGTIVQLKDTKNGKDRFVPVPSLKLADALVRCLKQGGLLYDVDKRRYQQVFREEADKLFPGRDIVPHTLRHTCASLMVAADVPLHVVSDFLGHRSLMTTRRYAHNATNALREAALKIFK